MERAVVLSNDKTLEAESIVLQTKEVKKLKTVEILNLEELEQMAIDRAMKQTEGNVKEAAKLLGITRYALYRKMGK
jgi:transcriptional regulator of acetoin/glycerol metabolism